MRGYRNGRRVEAVALDRLSALQLDEGAFAWIALGKEDRDALAAAAGRQLGFALPTHDGEAPWSRLAGEGARLVARLVAVREARAGIAYTERTAFVGRRYLVQVQDDRAAVDRLRARVEERPARLAHGPGYPLYALLDETVDGFLPVAAHLEQRATAFEALALAAPLSRSDLEGVLRLQHDLVDFRRALRLNQSLTEALLDDSSGLVDRSLRPFLRDVLDHAKRADVLARSSQHSIAALGNLAGLPAAESDRTVRTLTAWALMLAILTCFTALFSMYFPGIPGVRSPWGYPMFLLVVGGLCFAVYRRIHRRSWL